MMAKIEVMDRKEMRKIKDALHIDVRDGKLYVWGMFDRTVCIYPEEISAYDPDDPQITGTFTMKLPDTPPSPPAEKKGYWWCPCCVHQVESGEVTSGETHDPRCGGCGQSVDWMGHPPAEMPEVEPAPPNVTGGAPIIPGICKQWYRDVNGKPAKTCVGCKIACPAKGRVRA